MVQHTAILAMADPVPSYPMGPVGPGPGPQASGGPQTADALIFSSREISIKTVYFSLAK